MGERLISIIAAIDENRGIGKAGRVPWHIPGEQALFKEITQGHTVIMGRKTHESIGRTLPERKNIVITRDHNYKAFEGSFVAHSLEEALDIASQEGDSEIFVIGGEELYEAALGMANKLYLTLVPGIYEADSFFPDFSSFSKIVSSKDQETTVKGQPITYTTLILERG